MIKQTYQGSCHCGSLQWKFHTSINPEDWAVHSCQCSFCKTHSAQCTSDPSGAVEFFVSDQQALSRYRFGLKTADFLTCKNCGVYIAAVIESEHGCFTTVNLKSMQTPVEGLQEAIPISYDSEQESDRVKRRQMKWTPVTITV